MAVEYSEALAEKVCDLLAEGTTLARIGAMDGLPSRSTVRRWITRYPAFALAVADARIAGADAMAEDAIDISDTEPDPQRARVRVEARKWYVAAINPRRYGQKVDLNISQTIDLRAAHVSAMKRVDVMRQGLPAPDLEAPGVAFVFAQPEPVDPFS